MRRDLLTFRPSPGVETLLADIERETGTQVLLREGRFPDHDRRASARGGVDAWQPYVEINTQRKSAFDEHSLAHELLHIKRFCLDEVYRLETRSRVPGFPRRVDEELMVDDVTNQIEHVAFFPELDKLGFDPHRLADDWHRGNLEVGWTAMTGDVVKSWTVLKVAFAEVLGRDRVLAEKVQDMYEASVQGSKMKGREVAKVLRPESLRDRKRQRRVYLSLLHAAGVPPRALLLQRFDFSNRKTVGEEVP